MNLDALKQAETDFLLRYPGGFEHPDMVAVGKKHNVSKVSEYIHENLGKAAFSKPTSALDHVAKVVSRASLVSMFEKPKFQKMIKSMRLRKKQDLAEAFCELLYGKKHLGFAAVVEELREFKMAKWTIVSLLPAYFDLQNEVFIKPTTAKLIIKNLELDLKYNARPDFEFYQGFQSAIQEAKKHVDPKLAPNNPAFCGFMMMSFE